MDGNLNLCTDTTKHFDKDSEQHVFQNDPLYFKSLIGKKVEVELFNDSKHVGQVYCIDPVSESIILVNKSGDKYDTDIIFGYTVKKVNIILNELSDNIIFHERTDIFDTNCEERKGKIKNWLSKNLIEYVDDGDSLIVGEDLTILPPYTVERCLSNNTIILERIQSLLSKMPA